MKRIILDQNNIWHNLAFTWACFSNSAPRVVSELYLLCKESSFSFSWIASSEEMCFISSNPLSTVPSTSIWCWDISSVRSLKKKVLIKISYNNNIIIRYKLKIQTAKSSIWASNLSVWTARILCLPSLFSMSSIHP